ncbi:hypothetical protein WA026_005558 [Henosepilachna vigintioctopunctata]|uniref:Uncharacterized protein n=1 Tax=Henosepilachna vigintioctopunctata TaxID=420089 RepID=A0AAW1U2I1_9CUCU
MSLGNQQSDTTHQSAIFSEVEESVSVDTLRNQSNEFSSKEENSDHLCESFSNLELKTVNLEPENGTISSDSLKKRKWKWKWKFGSDTEEPGYVKNEEVREENDLNVLGLRSLDASYKKKKWWKWKFGAKGGEHCGTLAADVNNFAYLDVVPQNKELPSENPYVDSNKESSESPSFSRKEDIVFIKSDNFKDNRSKSKKWKWKWKFGSKDGENPKSEEFISLGLSKFKDSVSPVRKRDCCMNEDRLELPSLDNCRESRSTSVKLSSRFLRSASEPPNGNKSTEEETHIEEISRKSSTSSIQFFEVDRIQVEEYEKVLTPNETRPIDSISNVEKSLDGQMLNPTKTSESCTNDKQSLINSQILDKSHKKPDFASLIEECIQLGMPKKKELLEEVEINFKDSHARSSSKKITASSGPEHHNTSFDHKAVIEKCIQLCVPTTKDEIKSNTENAAEYLLHFNKQTCDTVDGANVEKPKIVQKSKETENNTASTTLSLEKPSEVLAMLKDPNSSTVVRNLTERSTSLIKYNEISKNDLEFLRRQLSIADKHLLQEALTSGISKEQEAFLIELLIMKRIMTEAKQSERPHNYTVGLNSSDESSQSKKNKIICYSEEPLDPVTLSIVKRILQRKSEDCEYNSPKSVDLFDKVNSKNCNFEIVLEERIKITLAGNRGVQNRSEVNSENERDKASVSRLCIQDNFSTLVENPTEKNLSQDATGIYKHNSDVKDQPKPVEVIKFIDSDSCKKSDTQKNQKCNMLEMSSSTSKLYENLSTDTISKTLAFNENSFKARKDYAALVEECIKLGMPKKKELTEDSLYANISELPGYSRCHSLTRHEKISKFRTEANENNQLTTSKTKAVTTDATAIMEECIMMGMPKKKDAHLTRSSYNLNSNKKTDKSPIVKMERKPDYKSLLEECIQLGMPKNKEVFSETRSSSPKASTFQVNSTRTPSVIPSSPLVRRIEQCINNANRSDTNEDPEEAIYANISATVGYSRLMQAKASESNKTGSCDKQQDYSALVDECIKLGMPSRNRSEQKVFQENRNANEILSSKNPHYEALIEECIQLGMPKRKETSEDAIYVNTLERYSNSNISPMMDFGCISPPPRRMLRSDSEPGFNKIPLVNVGNNRSGSAIPPYHSSMDRALEECIQLGWPKNKEMISSRRTVELTTFSNPSRNIDEGKTKESESKNVNVASVVRNTPEYQHMCCKTLPMATGAEEDSKLPGAVKMIEVPEIEEVQQVEPEKNGYKHAKLEYRVKIGI